MSKVQYYPKDKSNTAYGKFEAADANMLIGEIQNAVNSGGLTSNYIENDQLAKSIANIVSVGEFYEDKTFSYDHFFIEKKSPFKKPEKYQEGMKVCFKSNGNNLVNATINVDGLGEKPIKESINSDGISPNKIKINQYIELVYNSQLDSFILFFEDIISNKANANLDNLKYNILTETEDLNNIKNPGLYFLPQGIHPNDPITKGLTPSIYTVLVEKFAGSTIQHVSNAGYGQYRRAGDINGHVWFNWEKLSFSSANISSDYIVLQNEQDFIAPEDGYVRCGLSVGATSFSCHVNGSNMNYFYKNGEEFSFMFPPFSVKKGDVIRCSWAGARDNYNIFCKQR